MMYPIRIVKLTTGETLITGIGETGVASTVFTLERPMLITLVATLEKGKESVNSVYINNWIEFSNDEMFIIPKSIVVCSSMPDPDIKRDYNEAKIKFDMSEAEEELKQAQGDFEDEGEEDTEEDEDENSP